MKRLSSVLVLSLIAPGVIAQETDIHKIPGIDNTVGAIQALENQRDPKCDATAARLENFMYGTPLSHEGRLSKVELQKRLISTVWKDASDAARKVGADSISVDVLRPAVAKALPYTIDPAKNVYVTLGDGSKLLLAERDIRQYGSVAYGLRAILATQQDALLTPAVNLVPLSTDAVQLMKEMVDVYTLAALNLSDRAARKDGQKELTAPVIADAWKTIAPASAAVASAVLKPASSTTQPGAVLRKIIGQKLVSFRTYNNAADPLLYSNIQTYYARYPWPTDIEDIKKITAAFTGAVMDFIGDSLVQAQQKAKTAGDPVVREKHVAAVFDERAPYAVNIYEDVIFFANLPKSKQVYIEAYDADSLRDSGLHWHLIKQVIDSSGFPLKLDLDPFAAELLAEGDAQMAVLLFRVAGQIAKEKGDAVLSAGHVEAAQARIKERFAEHLKTKKTVNTSLMIASAPSASRPAAGQKHFSDGTERSGIDFLHRSSDWLNRFQRTFLYSQKGTDSPDPRKEPAEDLPPSFSGSGVAAEDINGDGRADLLLLSGLGNKLYLNKGGSFEDVTEKAGINWIGPDGKPGEPRQPVIADFDNDGRQDILITYVNASHRLYRNLGDGRFADVTTTAKFGGEDLVGGPAVAFDFDRDGLLDVYIGYYGNYIKGVGPNLARVNHNATPNKLFRNKGGFAFEDVSRGSGVENDGWTQAVASVDFNLDGWADLIVGNDFGVNAYYRNLGNGKFEDVATSLGTDLPSSSMNVGVSDLNKDGYPDVYISNIVSMVKDEKYVMPTEATKMKRNPVKLATMRVVQNNHLFTSIAPAKDRGLQYALNEAIDPADTSTGWAWDADFFDFDNDGDDDLYVVNGLHEYYYYASEFKVATAEGDKTMVFAVNDREPNVFFVNEKGRLVNRSSDSGADFSGNSRAAAYLDVDEDGDLDVVINNFNEKAIVLLNRSERTGNNWVKVKLVGDPSKRTNADAVGARVIATTRDGNRIWREVQSATGYMSVHPKEQHFGVGKQEIVDLVVFWPNGERREYKNLEANQVHRIKQ